MIEGQVEQWIREEKKNIKQGDVAFIPMDTVHASFNDTNEDVKILAILSPAVGEAGYELEDVSGEEPWNQLRSR